MTKDEQLLREIEDASVSTVKRASGERGVCCREFQTGIRAYPHESEPNSRVERLLLNRP